ncbi:hypothetical protein Bca52824_031912 [Brassica carinata]|uniref:Uncharacterized protein n=1 Tax=Brassica carinata TaxID=52824 RepID=A0A8X7V860_BRACI|nr:hypothetical protein Bca52824_031912 [Brassica carinata]
MILRLLELETPIKIYGDIQGQYSEHTNIKQPTDVPDSAELCDLLWSDQAKMSKSACGSEALVLMKKERKQKALKEKEMDNAAASSCKEREKLLDLRMRQEKVLHLDGSEKVPDDTHLQQAHPLETTTAHVQPACGGSTVEDLLVLAFECLPKKARKT